MADAAWYYAQNKQKVGPFSFTELQRLAASGRLSPTDMVLQADAQKWVAANAVHGLFPAANPPSAPAGALTPPAGSARPWASLRSFGNCLLHEGKLTAAATWGQTTRLCRYGYGLWRGRALRRRALATQLALGERLYAAGQGDADLRRYVTTLDEQARTAATPVGSTREGQREREGLLLRLGATALASPAPPVTPGDDLGQAQEARAAFQKHHATMRGLKAELVPRGAMQSCRIGIGYATVMAAVVLVAVLWPGGRAGRGNESALAAADGRSRSADDREVSRPPDMDRGGAPADEGRRPPEVAPEKRGPVHNGKPLGTWIAMLSDNDPSVRAEAAKALGELGPEMKTAVPLLIEALRERQAFARWIAARSLAKVGPGAAPAVDALIQALEDEDDVSFAAADALGAIGKDAVAPLIAVLKDKKPEAVKVRAALALGKIGPAAVPLLVDGLKKRELEDYGYASVALSKIGKPAVQPLIDLLAEKDEAVRRSAVLALGQIGPEAQAALPALTGLLKDSSADVRSAAGSALEKIKGGQGTQPDQVTLKKPNPDTRKPSKPTEPRKPSGQPIDLWAEMKQGGFPEHPNQYAVEQYVRFATAERARKLLRGDQFDRIEAEKDLQAHRDRLAQHPFLLKNVPITIPRRNDF